MAHLYKSRFEPFGKSLGVLSCKFLANNFVLSVNKLELAIVKEMHNIYESVLNYLVPSIRNRVFESIRKNGGKVVLIYILFLLFGTCPYNLLTVHF